MAIELQPFIAPETVSGCQWNVLRLNIPLNCPCALRSDARS
jgi:hypothetical protein